MQNFKYLFLFIILLNQNSVAQTQHKIDSLRLELLKKKDDSLKVHDRIRISWYLIQLKDSASAWKYINEADSIADKTREPVLKGIVYEHMGYLYNRQFSKKAITYYLLAENILKKYPDAPAAKKSLASLALNIGIEHMNQSDDAGALIYFFEGIKRYEKLDKHHFNLPILYGNIINSYYNMGKFEAALSYCEKAYQSSLDFGNDLSKMSACMNYGRVLYQLKRDKEGDIYLLKGKKIADSIGDNYFIGKYYQLMGGFRYDESNYNESSAFLIKGLPFILKTNSPFDISSYYNWLGIVNTALKKYDLAARYLDSSFIVAKENNYLFQVKDVYENKFKLERAKGKFEKALYYLDLYNHIKDSIQHINDADKIEFLDAKYQSEKKEQQILVQTAELKQRRIIITILIISLIGMLLTAFLYYSYLKQKQLITQQRINQLETEKNLTATSSVLKGEEQERTRLAKDLHDGLGGMLSGIKYSLSNMKGNLIMTAENALAFERSIDMLDSSIKEMRRVAHNMMPEALVKFGLDAALKDFCSDINQSGIMKISYQSYGMEQKEIEQTKSITIYRIVQELINNALKHSGAKETVVQLSLSDENLAVTVEDDGRGFEISELDNSVGIGWSNIKNRVEFLNANIDVNSKPGNGTSVHIEIKV